MKTLQQRRDLQEVPEFKFVEINGMKCTEPMQAYVSLYRALMDDVHSSDPFLEKISAKTAAHELEQKFIGKRTGPGRPKLKKRRLASTVDTRSTVVLMDELDLLVNKQQSVLYHFFDWPNRPKSRLIVIAVANTMDLPERALQGKIASRLGLIRVNFAPYTHGQLMRIVVSRLKDVSVFEEDAVELCARKVGAVSGDARRALDICRLAVELLQVKQQQQQKGTEEDASQSVTAKVTVDIVNQAVRDMFSSPAVACIRSSSLHEQIFLASTLKCIRKAGIGEATFGDVSRQHKLLCRFNGLMEPNSHTDLTRVCESLHASKIILCESANLGQWRRIRLHVGEEDVIMALRSDPFFRSMLK